MSDPKTKTEKITSKETEVKVAEKDIKQTAKVTATATAKEVVLGGESVTKSATAVSKEVTSDGKTIT